MRRIPPAVSPIAPRAIASAARAAFGSADDRHAELEQLLRVRYAADAVALLSSGTHALTAALRAATRTRGGGAVMLPAYTCYEVATAAVGTGAPVVLYDVDPDTLAPDWTSVRSAIGRDVAALVVAPLYGMSIDWDVARSAADELCAFLVEDAAQAHGATWRGAPVGSNGDFSVLSFGRGKGWTGAGGGALLWRRAPAQAAMTTVTLPLNDHQSGQELMTVARGAAQWLLSDPNLYGIPAAVPFLRLGETIYHAPTPLAPMRASSARMVLDNDVRSNAEAAFRRQTGAAYGARLGGEASSPGDRSGEGAEPGSGANAGAEHGYLRYPVRVKGGWTAAEPELARLGAGPPYPTTLAALPDLSAIALGGPRSYPGAETLVRELITLPTHSRTQAVERDRLIEVVARARVGRRPVAGGVA